MKDTPPTSSTEEAMRVDLAKTFEFRRQFIKSPTISFGIFMTEYPRLFDFKGQMVIFFQSFIINKTRY